jgi:DNA-binding MarR family transcriptional regulator
MFSLVMEQLVESRVQQDMAGDRLSRSQWRLLEIFALTEVRNVTDLAAFQGVSTAAASKAADRLVRMGLLTREEDMEDRRHIQLRLSGEGQRLTRDYLAALQARVTKVFADADVLPARKLAQEMDELTATATATRSEMERICLQCAANRHTACLVQQRKGQQCAFMLHHRVVNPLMQHAKGGVV